MGCWVFFILLINIRCIDFYMHCILDYIFVGLLFWSFGIVWCIVFLVLVGGFVFYVDCW